MKVSLRKHTINRQGYDTNGKYFGVGPAVYCVTVDGEDIGFVRTRVGESKNSVTHRVKTAVESTGGDLRKASFRWG